MNINTILLGNINVLDNELLHQKYTLMNIPAVEMCIQYLKINDRQRIIYGYNLLSAALYLRANYFTYCNIHLTRGHQNFNYILEKFITLLELEMAKKKIKISPYKF